MANKGTCKATDCNHDVVARGYCRKHYRLWRAGEMPKPRFRTCTFETCHKRRYRGSLCEEHWTAAHGKVEAKAAAPAAPAPAASA